MYICATTSFFQPIKAHRSVIAFNHRIPYICRRFSDILSHRIFRQLPLKSCSTTQCLIIESLSINKWLFTNAFSVCIREMEIVLVTCQNSLLLRGWNTPSLNHSWSISIYCFIVYDFNLSNWWQHIFSKTFRLCTIRFTSDVCYIRVYIWLRMRIHSHIYISALGRSWDYCFLITALKLITGQSSNTWLSYPSTICV